MTVQTYSTLQSFFAPNGTGAITAGNLQDFVDSTLLNATITGNGSANTSALQLNGTLYTSGTSSTNIPHLFFQTGSATAVTTWSTAGTYFGINADSAFGGNFIDFRVNGNAASSCTINTTGIATNLGNFNLVSAASNGAASTSVLKLVGTLFTGGTGTTNFPQYLAQSGSATAASTWSTSGTFIGVNADSGFAGNFIDFHINGGSSIFKVSSSASLTTIGGPDTIQFGTKLRTFSGGYLDTSTTGFIFSFGNGNKSSSVVAGWNTGSVSYTSDFVMGWSNVAYGSNFTNAVNDTMLCRKAAANIQLGNQDAASPVAQTLSVQSVVAGTTNTNGVNLTIAGSQGTGTGTGGSIFFQIAATGTTGTSQNALATVLTISSAGGFNNIRGSLLWTNSTLLLPSQGTNFFGLSQPSGTTGALAWGSSNLLSNAMLTWNDSNQVAVLGSFIISNSTTPATSSATGTTGTIAWDSSFLYCCVATNTWKRVAIATW